MFSSVLAVHEGLDHSGRFGAIGRSGQRISVWEFGTLLLLGAFAAVASVALTWRLGIPGHSIIRVVFPMALGLALVPRRGAASVMGLSGMSSATMLAVAGVGHLGPGSVTSLALTGLLIDAALLGARPGWTIYLRLTLAGVAANIVALLIRSGAKFLSGGVPTGKPLVMWLPEAVVTYVVCGALAGMLSAAVWFRFGADGEKPEDKAAA